jgi:hypothetical protein
LPVAKDFWADGRFVIAITAKAMGSGIFAWLSFQPMEVAMSTQIPRTQNATGTATRLDFFGRMVRRFRDIRMERASLEINRRWPGFGGTHQSW